MSTSFAMSPERAARLRDIKVHGGPVESAHATFLDWDYDRGGDGRLSRLYDKAQESQWHATNDIPWQTSVDAGVLPHAFLPIRALRDAGIALNDREKEDLSRDFAAWLLSQFVHGEQGALLAAAHVCAAADSFEVRRYAATQVADEARHVEVFTRYLDTKLGKRYPVDDSLLSVLEGLLADKRSDVKFLGMQIMVEGLAIGAFSAFYKGTRDPLLQTILRQVLRDEARHVQFGVEVLAQEYEKNPGAVREREEMAYEIAILMRDRLMAKDIYEEWFAPRMTFAEWKDTLTRTPGFEAFRYMTFRRLLPNLRAIGLLSERMHAAYEQAGLAKYFYGRAALEETALLADLDRTWW